MKRNRFWVPALLACGLVVTAVVSGEVIFVGQAGEVFDLAELNDGETRIFGRGDDRITAVRQGESVQVERDATADKQALSFTCNLATDSCSVITAGDDDEVMVKIERRLECVDGIGDCGGDALIEALGSGAQGHRVVVEKIIDCEGDDCRRPEMLFIGEGRGEVFDLADLGDGETRSFGDGPHRITTTRRDRQVTIEGPGRPGGSSCNLDTDRCSVITDSEMGSVMLKIVSAHAGARVLVNKFVKCDGDDCEDADVEVVIDGTPDARSKVIVWEEKRQD